MRIGEVATRSGLSAATIRFYERRGVLPVPDRRDNGYREYSAVDVDRARTFARFRSLGIDAGEAGRLADQCVSGQCETTWSEMPALVAGHRAALAVRIAELQELDARLAAVQDTIDATGQSDPLPFESRKELAMTTCTCDPGCCGGPPGPCC
jgi:MerR family transcriptional regulator, copper efflux regulator